MPPPHTYKLLEAPGVFTRCDKHVSCFPYSDRDQASLDFLCCEDAGWVGAHVINPMAIALFFGWKAAIIFAFWFEVLEALLLIFFKNFIFTTTAETDLETLAGSVVGDAFINGSLGAAIGYLICEYTGHVPPFQRWLNMVDNWHRFKYVMLFLLFELCFALLSLSNWAAPLVFVAVIAVGIDLFAIYVPLTNYPADVKFVWRGERGVYARNLAFSMYVLIAIFIYLNNCGIEYGANDWYQVWFACLIVIFGLKLLIQTRPRTK